MPRCHHCADDGITLRLISVIAGVYFVFFAAGSSNGLASWLASIDIICSQLYSYNDTYEGNQAVVAGAVIYSTDAPSTYMYCQDTSTPINNTHCPEWMNPRNPNGLIPASLGFQYGPGMAFPAQNIILGSGSNPNETIKSFSDGSPLQLPPIHVVDQAGQIVQLQGLQATLNVTDMSALPAEANNVQLSQGYAQADQSGYFTFASAVLTGVPFSYSLIITVPEVRHYIFSKNH